MYTFFVNACLPESMISLIVFIFKYSDLIPVNPKSLVFLYIYFEIFHILFYLISNKNDVILKKGKNKYK